LFCPTTPTFPKIWFSSLMYKGGFLSSIVTFKTVCFQTWLAPGRMRVSARPRSPPRSPSRRPTSALCTCWSFPWPSPLSLTLRASDTRKPGWADEDEHA
jgi:hypothetical protein